MFAVPAHGEMPSPHRTKARGVTDNDAVGAHDCESEPPLSTTTSATGRSASLCSSIDDDVAPDVDARDDDAPEDLMLPTSSPPADEPPTTASVHPAAEGGDADAEVTPTTGGKDRKPFSLIALPKRLFGRRAARKHPAPDTTGCEEIKAPSPTSVADCAADVATECHGASLVALHEEAEVVDTEMPLSTPAGMDTLSPSTSPSSSGYGGLTFPSLTSFASLTRSLSAQRIDNTERDSDGHPSDHEEQRVEHFKSFWDEKLRSTMEKMALRNSTPEDRQTLDVFHLVLKLYAHQDVIEDLYGSYEANAPDFEFYIPQLCTFLVHGNYAKRHQLECFLLSRSGESLVFAHRLGWFLRSFSGDALRYHSESLSVTCSPENEDADLLCAIQQKGGIPAVLMSQGLSVEEVSESRPNVLLRRASSFDIDSAAAAQAVAAVEQQQQRQHELVNQSSCLPDDRRLENDCDEVAFAAYLQSRRESMMYEALPDEGNARQIALYNATPEFVTSLTNLADELLSVPLSQRNERLRDSLQAIHDEVLPSNVIYLPIGNCCHRVKGILVDECFTFSTKERVPYFLCVEVIDFSAPDVDELNQTKKSTLISRNRKRGFGLQLRFKKTCEDDHNANSQQSFNDGMTTSTDTSASDESPTLAAAQSLLDGLDISMDDSQVGSAADVQYRGAINYDLIDPGVLALTPEKAMNDNQVANQMQECEDESNPVWSSSRDSSTDQKLRMGQWSLPRVRRRHSVSTSTSSTKSGNSFYSSWFSKKAKEGLPETPRSRTEPSPIQLNYPEAAIETPVDVDEDAVETPVDSADTRKEPVPEPTTEQSVGIPQSCESDDEHPRRRGRDTSVSLDFMDGDAWKVNFELEEVLAEPESHDSCASPHGSSGVIVGEEEQEVPIIVFRERWSEKEDRIRRTSVHGSHPGWRLLPVIVKSNDDLRQEQFAAQLIAQCDRIFRGHLLPLRLRPYNVIATSAKTGLIEAVPDTVSLDSLKRNDPDYTTLLDFYQRLFGDIETAEFRLARRNFVESLAAYSIVCYVFQIKDRHNGNILLDTEGHVIHIDFGFLLTNSPGSNLNFERAPFKLTDEFVELMGGPRSAAFRYFRSLCIRAYLAMRRNMEKIVLLVEMMLVGNEDLPCFAGGKRAVIDGLRERLKPGARTSECQVFVNQLIDRSINNWRTRWYDKYQRAWVGIL